MIATVLTLLLVLIGLSIPVGAALGALGQFVFQQAVEEPGGRPALAVGTLGKLRP